MAAAFCCLILSNAAPSITLEPRSQFAWEGRLVNLNVSAIGTPPLTYQWQFNGADLAQGTNRVLSMSRVNLTNEGDYQVIVADTTGTATSKVARLMVRGRPEPTGPEIPKLTRLDDAMRTVLTNHGIPGGSLAVVKDGRLVFARGYGWAHVEDNERFQPDTLSQIGSLTKTIAAATIMKLVEDGELSLDDRAFNLLNYEPPDYAGAIYDERITNITVRHLLNHKAGWNRTTAINPLGGRGFDAAFWPTWVADDLGLTGVPMPRDVVRWMLGKPLQANPGAQFSYSNIGYIVAGRLIEQITQQSFEMAARELLAEAAVTRIQIVGDKREGRMQGEAVYYVHPTITSEVVETWGLEAKPVDFNLPYAYLLRPIDSAGALIGSAVEYARFVAAIDGSPSYPDILETNSVRTMATGILGWDSADSPNPATGIWYKGASLPGASGLAVKWRNGIVFVFLFNSLIPGSTGAVNDLYNRLNNTFATLTWPTNDLFAATLSYDAWRAKAFSTAELGNATVSGDHADPDEDGLPNLAEYAHGDDPRKANVPARIPGHIRMTKEGGVALLSYRRLLLEHELDYVLESSPDLRIWSQLSSQQAEAPALNEDGTVTASVNLGSTSGAATRFVRLRITRK